jgi:hypothetical protein
MVKKGNTKLCNHSATHRNRTRIPAFRMVAAMLDDNENAGNFASLVYDEIWRNACCGQHRRHMARAVAIELAWMLAQELATKYETQELGRDAVLEQIRIRLEEAEQDKIGN